MARTPRSRTLAVAAATTALALAGCSAGGQAGSSADPTSGGDAATPTEIDFWGWAPGYAAAVDAFNASQDGIVVNYEEVSPGSQGGYERMLNAVTAGDAPCLGQVGYETLTSFLAQGALLDVSEQAADDEGDFVPAAWNAVSIGDGVYGAPVDTGPVALFYRTDVFQEAGVEVPTTWEEYRAAGEAIRAQNPSRYLTSAYLNYDYAGFAQQAGANWFSIDGDAWNVSIDSEENLRVAEYWQGITDAGLVSPAPMWDQSWYTALSDGTIATHVGAAWIAGVLKGSAAEGSGQWAVAPMPQWEAGGTDVANVGGSATAVFAGCEDPEAAWTFAHWMSTDRDAYAGLVTEAGLYPAATALLDLPELAEGDPYFGGQAIFDVFAEASPNVVEGWTWGPNMPATVTALDDALAGAWAGNGTIADALRATQSATVSTLEADGISVASE